MSWSFARRAKRICAAFAVLVALIAIAIAGAGCGTAGTVATASTQAAGPTTTKLSKPDPQAKLPARDPKLVAKTRGAPNYVVVVVDDQSSASFKRRYMPNTYKWIVDHGTRFPNGLAAPPLCCPDRAGILTGQYPHDNGVFTNHPGYPELRDKRDTLPVWMHTAGYRTGFVGKYLNHYTRTAGSAPAPGFDSWLGFYGSENYTNYRLTDGSNVISYGKARNDYSTDVLTAGARDFIRSSSEQPNPFLLYLAYHAPHRNRVRGGHCKGHNPRPASKGDYLRYRHARLPQPPSYNERNVKDKPLAIASLPRISKAKQGTIRKAWKCTLATMRDIDVGVGRIMRELHHDGELGKTVVVYVSDNGVFFGEHRIASGKQFAYEPALQVPYAIRVPPSLRKRGVPRSTNAVVSNEDIAPTLLDLAGLKQKPPVTCAGATDCRTLDGRSLASLLGAGGHFPADRGVLAEIKADETAYRAIRTQRYVLIDYEDGEEELYDLARDPFELRNRAGLRSARNVQHRLQARLTKLRDCAGVRGRDSRKAGRPFCE